MLDMVERALLVAYTLHKYQKDKSGKPYIYHVMRVADGVNTDYEKTVALLHDVIEDTHVTEDALMNGIIISGFEETIRFSFKIVQAVVLLTKEEQEPNIDYYNRLKVNDLSRRVKVADLLDNLTSERMFALDERTQQRLYKKYNLGLDIMREYEEQINTKK